MSALATFIPAFFLTLFFAKRRRRKDTVDLRDIERWRRDYEGRGG